MTPFDPKSPPLSHECLRYIEELDRDYDKDFPSEEDQQMSELFRTITETVFHSRQGFTVKGGVKVDQWGGVKGSHW